MSHKNTKNEYWTKRRTPFYLSRIWNWLSIQYLKENKYHKHVRRHFMLA